MIVNEDEEESVCEASTMQRHDTAVINESEKTYVPLFIEHFKKQKEEEEEKLLQTNEVAHLGRCEPSAPLSSASSSVQKTYQPIRANAQPHPLLESDFDFLRFLPYEELHLRMANLDGEMNEELVELDVRYTRKRQPILDAIDSKKSRQLDL